jgi:LacI family repressor for deo operon, udp, cdd, tsx, nupC, and nupG
MATRATGWEVARAANVSQSTVSLVLSGRAAGRVSVRTQELVRRVADELGYRPHAAARSLRLGRSGLVMLVVPDVQNPFFARVLDGAQQAAQENHVSVLLGSGEHGTVVNDSVNAVDGLLVCSKQPSDMAVGIGQIPMVVMDTTPPPGVPCIRLGVAAGMTTGVRRLIELGHEHIGYMRAQPRTPTFLARWRAFQRATVAVHTQVCIAGLSVADAERVGAQLLDTSLDRVTAMVCDDDLQAAGVYRAARASGIRIPDDLSVLGFGNTVISRLLSPDLTTIELYGEELGRTGLITLLQLIEDKRPATRVMLRSALVERGSTARAPQRGTAQCAG